MAGTGFSVGTFTGGGTFAVELLTGTYTPVGVVAWGGAGTVTRVGPTAGAALPVNVAGGTLNAGTVTVANTGTVVGTVTITDGGNVISVDDSGGALTVDGTVGLSGGTISTIAAGTIGISGGTISTIAAGTIAISTIAAGTVVATAAGTQTVAGTVSVSGGTIGLSGGTISTIAAGTVAISTIAAGTIGIGSGTVGISGGTISTIAAGTIAISTIAAGTVVADQRVGGGKTLQFGTLNLTSGSVSLVNPGAGTTAYIVGMALTAGTSGIIQFLQGVGAAALSGPIPVDQYGGFVDRGRISEPILKSASGSQIYVQITSGIGTLGGYYSYFVE